MSTGVTKIRQWTPWDQGQELVNLARHAGLSDSQICERMGVSNGFLSTCRTRGKIATLAFTALKGVVSDLTAPNGTEVRIGIPLSHKECQLILVMSTLCQHKLPSREAEILDIIKKMAKRISSD